MIKVQVIRERTLKGIISFKYIIGYYKTLGNNCRIYWRGKIIDIKLINKALYAFDVNNENTTYFDTLGETYL